jgi:hypothetical protein
LEYLFLNNNTLFGTIPSQYGSFINISQIDIGGNQLTGVIPDELGDIYNLTQLLLTDNSLEGTLPRSFSKMTSLEVGYNYLTASFPDGLCESRSLAILDLSFNLLDGVLPDCLGSVDSMKDFVVGNNFFSSSIPANLDNLKYLEIFDASNNLFVGSFPIGLTTCFKINQLLLNNNLFSGPLPTELGNLRVLLSLDISSVSWTGSMPSEIGLASEMRLLNIFDTQLTGAIPSSFGNFGPMEGMFLYNNLLSQAIPSELASDRILQYLNLQYNMLTQSIPTELIQLDSLVNFQVEMNHLSGENPLSLGVGLNLNYLVASGNHFSGSLPSNFTAFKSIQYLYMDTNAISGPLPDFGMCEGSAVHTDLSCSSLVQLSLFGNRITGTISETIGSHTNIAIIAFSNNNLRGQLPKNLYKLNLLQVLNISSNFLSGKVDIFPANYTGPKFPNLTYVDFSNNTFTGSIPSGIFLSESLQVASLSSNCFSGPVPITLCDSKNLKSVVMNSLSSGTNCKKQLPLLSRYLDGVFPKKIMSGSVPTCLWSISSLSTLHLSGNGLSGFIPDTPLVPILSNVELGGNALTGTIPMSVQTHGRFTTLGLQQNKLTGTLSQLFIVNANASNVTNLNLKVNRLSGTIPNSFLALPSVDILTGNMFSCVSESSLPPNDPASNNYSCGSVALNTALITWVILVFGVVVLWAFFLIAVNRISKSANPAKYQHSKSITALIDLRRYRRSVNDETQSFHSSRPESANSSFAVSDSEAVQARRAISGPMTIDSLPSSVRSSTVTASSVDLNAPASHSNKPYGRKKLTSLKDIVARVFLKTVQWHTVKLEVIRNNIRNTCQFLDVLRGVSNGMIVLSLVYVFVCMIYYICVKNNNVSGDVYSTQSFQYGWLVSSAFIHGYLPATFLLVFVFCSLYLMCSSVRRSVQKSGDDVDLEEDNLNPRNSKEVAMATSPTASVDAEYEVKGETVSSLTVQKRVRRWLVNVYFFVLVPFVLQGINATVTITVNAEYVRASESISANYLILLQSSISAFKIGWACLYVPWAVSNLKQFSTRSQLRHQVTMYLVVVVVAPVLAAVATDQRCFYQAIFGSPAVTTAYQVPTITETCTESLDYSTGAGNGLTQARFNCGNSYDATTVASTATPPFIYSYQCGSAILVDFVPVLVYTYVFSSIILPFIRFTILHTPFHSLHRTMPHWLYQLFVANSLLDCDDEFITYKPITYTPTQHDPESAMHLDGLLPLFDGSIIVAKRLLDFGIMLTFGLACPPLGLAVAFSVMINASVWILMIGKFLSSVGSDNKLAIDKLEASTKELLKGAVSGMWIVVFAVCMFWSIMVYDMVADVDGNYAGLAYALVCLVAFPLSLLGLVRFGDQFQNDVIQKFTAFISNAVTSRVSLAAALAVARQDSGVPRRTPNTSSTVNPLVRFAENNGTGINGSPPRSRAKSAERPEDERRSNSLDVDIVSMTSDEMNSMFTGSSGPVASASGANSRNISTDMDFDMDYRNSVQMRDSLGNPFQDNH